jgi:hypothetical protein
VSSLDAKEIKAQLLAMANGNGAGYATGLPEYPLSIWPDILAEYFTAYARMIDAPVGMIACPAAPVLAGIIGNRRPIFEKIGHRIHPAIWTVEIAEPSTAKSPMLAGARELAVQLQVTARMTHDSAKRAYALNLQDLPRGQPEPPPPPDLEHFYTDDCTVEQIGPICEASAGVVFTNDELLRWLKSFNAYKGGKGADWETWLSFWSGIRHNKIDRKTQNLIMPERGVVCLCGSIQPDRLNELSASAVKDGMLARFLMSTYPANVQRVNDNTLPDDLVVDAVDLAGKLRLATETEPVFFSPAARKLYAEWWNDDMAPRAEASHGPVRHFLGKLKDQILKLAALLHCVHDPRVVATNVGRRTIEDAIDLIDFHRAHTLHAYQYLALPSDQSPVNPGRKILWTIRRLGGSATLEEIRVARGNHDKAAFLLEVLGAEVEASRLTVEMIPTGGRPATRYTIAEENT